MILLVATLSIQPNKVADFEKVMGDLCAKVRGSEPGNKFYQLCKGQSVGEYCIVERYVDQAAMDHHMKTPHFTAAMPQLVTMLAAEPKMTTYIEI